MSLSRSVNLVQIPRQGAAGREKVHLEDEMAAARVILPITYCRRPSLEYPRPPVPMSALVVYFH